MPLKLIKNEDIISSSKIKESEESKEKEKNVNFFSQNNAKKKKKEKDENNFLNLTNKQYQIFLKKNSRYHNKINEKNTISKKKRK